MYMATGERVDPYGVFRFMVEIDGIGGKQYGVFRECSGFSSEIAVTEHPQGGEEVTRKLPGRVKYANIVLKWGLTDSTELYDWHREAAKGNTQRRNGSIVVHDRQGNEVARWNFFQAWPSKWDGPDFNAASDDIAIETLELAHEGIERVRVR
jgi:phage tail-like protein